MNTFELSKRLANNTNEKRTGTGLLVPREVMSDEEIIRVVKKIQEIYRNAFDYYCLAYRSMNRKSMSDVMPTIISLGSIWSTSENLSLEESEYFNLFSEEIRDKMYNKYTEYIDNQLNYDISYFKSLNNSYFLIDSDTNEGYYKYIIKKYKAFFTNMFVYMNSSGKDWGENKITPFMVYKKI